MCAEESSGRYEVNRPEIVDSVIDGEVVAICLSTGSYYNIAGVGTEVWSALDRPVALQEIVELLGERYDAGAGEIDASVTRFVDELLSEGLIRQTDAFDSGPATAPAGASGKREKFTPPTFEKFTDMEDLLLLDPVHDVTEQGWPHVRNA